MAEREPRLTFKTAKEKMRYYTRKDNKGCHIWTALINDSGYGIVHYNGSRMRAHRLAYEIYIGPIPDGTVIHHICSNKSCVNPKHLQAITPHQNVAEMHERRYYKNKIAELEKKLSKYE